MYIWRFHEIQKGGHPSRRAGVRAGQMLEMAYPISGWEIMIEDCLKQVNMWIFDHGKLFFVQKHFVVFDQECAVNKSEQS